MTGFQRARVKAQLQYHVFSILLSVAASWLCIIPSNTGHCTPHCSEWCPCCLSITASLSSFSFGSPLPKSHSRGCGSQCSSSSHIVRNGMPKCNFERPFLDYESRTDLNTDWLNSCNSHMGHQLFLTESTLHQQSMAAREKKPRNNHTEGSGYLGQKFQQINLGKEYVLESGISASQKSKSCLLSAARAVLCKEGIVVHGGHLGMTVDVVSGTM